MVFSVFIFLICLEPTVRQNIWMRTISVTVMVIFKKCYSQRYLIVAVFKSRCQKLRATLTTAF